MMQLAAIVPVSPALLDMHTQMAQRMVEVQLRGNRVFPSVRINDDVIDNVVVGENGVYLVQLIPAPAGAETARFERGSIIFEPCGTRVSLQQNSNTMLRLGKTPWRADRRRKSK